jgi:hypothetical protein
MKVIMHPCVLCSPCTRPTPVCTLHHSLLCAPCIPSCVHPVPLPHMCTKQHPPFYRMCAPVCSQVARQEPKKLFGFKDFLNFSSGLLVIWYHTNGRISYTHTHTRVYKTKTTASRQKQIFWIKLGEKKISLDNVDYLIVDPL